MFQLAIEIMAGGLGSTSQRGKAGGETVRD
jgi:hypothetical protein